MSGNAQENKDTVRTPELQKEPQKEKELPPPYRYMQEMPEPVGGLDAVYQFIQENLVYPAAVKQKDMPAQIFVEFIIEADGTISNPKILKGIHPELDAEVIRVVSMLPKWKPGKYNGKFARCFYQIPVRLKL